MENFMDEYGILVILAIYCIFALWPLWLALAISLLPWLLAKVLRTKDKSVATHQPTPISKATPTIQSLPLPQEEPKNPYEPTEPTVPKKVEEEGFCLSCLYWLIMIPLAILGLILFGLFLFG